MAKKESKFGNMLITLLVVTVVAGGALGGVYTLTKDTISQQKIDKENNAVWEVFMDAQKSTEEETVYLFDKSKVEIKKRAFAVISEPKSATFYKEGGGDSIIFFDLFEGENYLGSAIKTLTNKGFSGRIEIMVGFTKDGMISGTSVLDHKETPGLGDKMDASVSDFPKQFWGVQAEEMLSDGEFKVKKDGGKVDAITAATISSRAFCDAIQSAYNLFVENKIGGDE